MYKKKLFKIKNVYKYKQYLFIKVKEWFGIVHHNVDCPNYKYKNTSVILFKWMITNINKK